MTPERRLFVLFLIGLGAVMLPIRRPLAATMAGAGRPAAYFFTLTCCVLLLTQAFLTHGHLYPFASWTMYGQASPPRIVWDVQILRSDGSADRLDPWRVVRGPDARALMRGLENRLSRIEATGDPGIRDAQWVELGTLLDAMIRLEARRGDRAPAEAVAISRCRLQGVAPWGEEDFTCEAFQVLSVEDGRIRAP